METLLREESSAGDLARQLDMTPAGVRQHLATLLAQGLIERRRLSGEPHRPTELYRLSAAGRRAFPKRYDLLLARVIEVLAEREGPGGVAAVVEEAGRRVAARVRPELPAEPDARHEAVTRWLEAEFEWEAAHLAEAGVERIVVHHCPFQDVSNEWPAVCGRFFCTVLAELEAGVTATHAPGAEGQACCAFVLRRE